MPRLTLFGFLVALCLGVARPAFAIVHSLPASLAAETLSETVPTAFAPAEFAAADFTLEWVGRPLPGVRVALGRGSLTWVRVSDFLVLPRALLLLSAEHARAGQVSNAGFVQHAQIDSALDVASVEMPVSLISGEKNPIQVVLLRDGRRETGELRVRFKPRVAGPRARVYTDSSCSPFHVTSENSGARDDEWVYVGCRLVYADGDEHRVASLEMFVYWDNIGQTIEVAGIDTPASSVSVWALRLRSKPGFVDFREGSHRLRLNYQIPERLHFGSLALGVGPYRYSFESPGKNVSSVAPMVTLYGSFFIQDSVRLVAFNATALHSTVSTDLGIYLSQESIKTFDRRISFNLMLGGHVQGFRSPDGMTFKLGAPQGFEIDFRDFFHKSRNLAVGGFIYPLIDGKEYYNTWLRWGSASLFAEINYIAWRENFNGAPVFSRAAGVTIGFPLVSFL